MKWEYTVFWLGSYFAKELNEMGQSEWELVAVILDDESYRVFMKRPVDEEAKEYPGGTSIRDIPKDKVDIAVFGKTSDE